MGNIIDRRRMMGGKKLPYDAEIEYLESTKNQFIELPFGFDNTDEVFMNFSINVGQVDSYMVSPKVWNDNRNRFAFGSYRGFTFAYGSMTTGNTYLIPQTDNDGNIHQWSYSNYMFRITDLNLERNVSTYFFGGTSANLRLFYGYNSPSKGKILYYKHIKGVETVIELIPVRVGQVGYMYDKVSGQLFGNAGTGEFILGPDKVTGGVNV